MALALLHLSRATGEPRYAALARRTVDAFLGDLQRAPRALLTLARAAVEIVDPPAASVAETRGSRRVVTRGAVTLEARPPRAPVRAGGRLELEVVLSMAPGSFVLAHGASARRTWSGSASACRSTGRASAVRGIRRGGRAAVAWARDPIAVHDGPTAVPVTVELARTLAPGVRSARIRVVFQACDASGCRPPESVTLEVPVTVAAPR